MKKFLLKPVDFIIIIITLTAIFFSLTNLSKKDGSTAILVINTRTDEYVYSLDKDRTIKVEGISGVSTIEIKNKTAFFTDSPCPNKLCVQSNPIKSNNDWAACMPNHVFMHVESKENDNTVDITTR